MEWVSIEQMENRHKQIIVSFELYWLEYWQKKGQELCAWIKLMPEKSGRFAQ